MRTRKYVLLALLCISIALLAVSPPSALADGTMSLNPTEGRPGTSISVTGSGWPASTSYTLWFDKNGNGARDLGEPYNQDSTNSSGGFSWSVSAPTVPNGSYNVLFDLYRDGSVDASASFTITPGITLTPTSGAPGTVIGISGNGFLASTAGYLWFDTNGDSVRDGTEPQAPVTTGTTGVIPTGTNLTAPTAMGGTYQVRADIPEGSGIEASASFTVKPGITLSPASGIMDTVITITVTGSGFEPSANGYVWFDTDGDSVMDETEPNASVNTDGTGAIPAGTTLDTPLLPPYTTYKVHADIPSGAPIEANATFTIAITTTALTVTKYDFYGNVIGTRYISYQEMAANMTVQGDGTTHYYHQGPIFEDEWEACYGLDYTGGDWGNSSEKWDRVWNATTGVYDQMEECNYKGKDYGACRGTNVSDLCELVGGMFTGETVRIKSPDGFSKNFSYDNVYEPEPRQGPMVVTWYTKWEGDGVYVSDNYTDGMRLIFFADTSTNNASDYVFGIGDAVACLDPQYYHYYPEGGILYPTTTGLSVKWISDIIIDSNERCGDVNRDGDVSVADTTLLKFYVGAVPGYEPKSMWASDVTGDVDITVADTTLLKFYVGAVPGWELSCKYV